MLAVARPLDLTQNIFQDGQWGTLRYVTFSSIFCVPQIESSLWLTQGISACLCF